MYNVAFLSNYTNYQKCDHFFMLDKNPAIRNYSIKHKCLGKFFLHWLMSINKQPPSEEPIIQMANNCVHILEFDTMYCPLRC